jgi:hypothetical protein
MRITSMSYDPEQAQKWRMRADELRARADATKDPVARRTFLNLADAWDQKADRAEQAPWTPGKSPE